MIGYGAANAIGQGIAIKEKIFCFAVSHLIFFYKSLPKIFYSVVDEGVDKSDLLLVISEKIEEYFEQYVIETETVANTTQTQTQTPSFNYNDRSVMAKYYLAAIYYYEPNFDFGKVSINDIYEIGKAYLIELFKENIIDFSKRAIEYIPGAKEKEQPKLDDDSPENRWRYFAIAMLKSRYSGELNSLIQQPVSIPSRINEKFIDYAFDKLVNAPDLTNYLMLELAFAQNFKEASPVKGITVPLTPFTHRNKKIEVALKNLQASAISLQELRKSTEKYFYKSFEYLAKFVILNDKQDDGGNVWDTFWNYPNFGGNILLQEFRNFYESFDNKLPTEARISAYNSLEKTLIGAINLYGVSAASGTGSGKKIINLKKDFKIKGYKTSGWADEKNNDGIFIPTNDKTNKPFYPIEQDPPSTIFGKYGNVGIKYVLRQYFEYNTNIDKNVPLPEITLLDVLIQYYNLLQSYKKYFFSEPIIWEDSPNVIKYYDNSQKRYIDTENEDAWIGKEIDGSSFITFYNTNGTLIYPSQKDLEERETKIYFEFSFRPNKERMIEKLKLEKNSIFLQDERYEKLVNEYALNFSKTETYDFLKKFENGQLVKELTLEDFNSIFELCVTINYKITQKYLNQSDPVLKSLFLDNSNFYKTDFSVRKWKGQSANQNSNIRHEIIYNPIMNKEKNIVLNVDVLEGKEVTSIEINACVPVGFVDEYGIDIRTFNPAEVFKEEENVNRFLQAIAGTSIEDYLKSNFNFNPYSIGSVVLDLLSTKASYFPRKIIMENERLLLNSYSQSSKNLLDSLITNIETIQAGT